jgi:superoxide reductase
MHQEFHMYRCSKCGTVADVFGAIDETPTCCDQPMTLLNPNTTDGAGEKHVPVIERNGENVVVKVGEVPHPMEEVHYIEWIALVFTDRVERIFLSPGDAPEATFTVAPDDAFAAYEYCNLHGLWKKDAEMV